MGKRMVTSDPDISEYTRTHLSEYMPRVYFSKTLCEGIDKDLTFELQPDSPLLRLPAEIRNHILDYTMPTMSLSMTEIADKERDGTGEEFIDAIVYYKRFTSTEQVKSEKVDEIPPELSASTT